LAKVLLAVKVTDHKADQKPAVVVVVLENQEILTLHNQQMAEQDWLTE
jgi:hypothetical protein